MLSDHLAHAALTGLRPNSITARRQVLAAFARSIAPLAVTSAGKREVEAFLSRPLSPSSRRTYLTHLRGFFRWCVEEGHVEEDPTARIKTIKVKKGTPRPITADELALAIEQAPPRMKAWITLMAFAGLRCLEVAALRPCDLIDSEVGTLLYLRETKGGGTATVPAHQVILDALAVLPIRDNLWWSMTANSVSTEVSRYLHGLGIDASAHRLRHSAGTAFYSASGHDLLTTAKLLRHQSVNTTMIYARIDPERPAEVVRLMPVPRVEAVAPRSTAL
jgi:integrase/recombinase XerD